MVCCLSGLFICIYVGIVHCTYVVMQFAYNLCVRVRKHCTHNYFLQTDRERVSTRIIAVDPVCACDELRIYYKLHIHACTYIRIYTYMLYLVIYHQLPYQCCLSYTRTHTHTLVVVSLCTSYSPSAEITTHQYNTTTTTTTTDGHVLI